MQTLRGYQRPWLVHDCVAGLTVCMVMVPSVIAYAGLAGLPPITGLYAALAALVGYALFASSRHVIAGPDAALTLLVGVAIAPLAQGDPARAAVLAAALAITAGAVLLLTAVLRAGAVADLLSKPVLVGYLTGAALILMSTQLGKFFGLAMQETEFLPVIGELWRRLPEVHGLTTWIGLGLVALQVVLGLVAPRVPSALVVCVVALGASWMFDLKAHGVALVGGVQAGLPTFAFPVLNTQDGIALVPGALAVALLTVPEGILLARAFAARNGYSIRSNQEIAALGVANVVSGLFQGFSVGASQSRTAVNESSGGKTPVVGLVAAAGLVAFLLFLTPVLEHLPSVALGAILIYAGARLIDIHEYQQLARFRRRSVLLALLVMAGVLVFGVLQGILLGVSVTLVFVLGRLARPMDVVLRQLPGTDRYHDLGADDAGNGGMTAPGVVAYRFYAPLMFANADWFAGRVRALVDAHAGEVRCFVLDAQAITEIDATAADVLMEVARELRRRGVALRIARANRPLREILENIGFVKEFGDDALAPSVHAAVNGYLKRGAAAS
ncbi:MAG: sulfate permease [Phycisphaerales bacterium]